MDKIKRTKYVECTYCYGSGWVHVYSFLAQNPCPRCNEKGKVLKGGHDDILNQLTEERRKNKNL